MTAKEALLERVKHLTEEQAEELLRQLPGGEKPAAEPDLLTWARELFAEIPDAELDQWPSSSEIDNVVYGLAE